jgi:succinate dehydrogenase/fumarate reductase flavoprotein subunit
VAHFPHLIERAKPGLIAVDARGRRFVNEADSYHDFMSALLAASQPASRCRPGCVRPPLHPPLRPGRGQARAHAAAALVAQRLPAARSSLAELAPAASTAGLQATVQRYNAAADKGGPRLCQGRDALQPRPGRCGCRHRQPLHGAAARGPFYAVRVLPGSLGTFAGLRTNAQAQVLDAQGRPIPGLYAAGNDMNSLMGGHYPSGGITLGPAMTFGFIAAHHAAGVRCRPGARSPRAFS